jgi:uncharacterized membrane protein
VSLCNPTLSEVAVRWTRSVDDIMMQWNLGQNTCSSALVDLGRDYCCYMACFHLYVGAVFVTK